VNRKAFAVNRAKQKVFGEGGKQNGDSAVHRPTGIPVGIHTALLALACKEVFVREGLWPTGVVFSRKVAQVARRIDQPEGAPQSALFNTRTNWQPLGN
jgi:hypothetical protein